MFINFVPATVVKLLEDNRNNEISIKIAEIVNQTAYIYHILTRQETSLIFSDLPLKIFVRCKYYFDSLNSTYELTEEPRGHVSSLPMVRKFMSSGPRSKVLVLHHI